MQAQELENQYGIMVVEPDQHTSTPDPDNDHLFCVVYYPSVRNISDKVNSTKHPLSKVVDLGVTDTCVDGDKLSEAEHKFGFINGSSSIANCSIAERAQRMEKYGAEGLISDRIISAKYNSSEYSINIEVLTLVERNAKERINNFQTKYPEGIFYIYENGSDEKSFDASLIVILVMAVMTVILGSFWSGHAKQNLRLKKEREAAAEAREEEADCIQPQDGSGAAEEELSIHVSPLLVLFFVLCMCSMLVLLYFFFNQLGEQLYNKYYE